MAKLRPLRQKPLRKLQPLGRRGSPAFPIIAEGKAPARKGTGKNPSTWPVVAPDPQLAEARKKQKAGAGRTIGKSAKERQRLLAKYGKVKPPPRKAMPQKGLARGLRRKAIGRRGKVTGGERLGIPHIPMVSSNVESAAYDPKQQILEVSFLSGSTYQYYSVPRNVWTSFQRAPSPGRFVWRTLRGWGGDDRFAYARIE